MEENNIVPYDQFCAAADKIGTSINTFVSPNGDAIPVVTGDYSTDIQVRAVCTGVLGALFDPKRKLGKAWKSRPTKPHNINQFPK